MHLSQIDLVSAISKHIERKKVSAVSPRRLNAIVAAADLIVGAFAVEDVMATPGMGLRAWLHCDDTGTSSLAMAARLIREVGGPRIHVEQPSDHPLDPDDFGRCVRLLEAVPEFRPHLAAMASVSPAWKALVEHWDELEALYRERLPSRWMPILYARMQRLIDGAETEGD